MTTEEQLQSLTASIAAHDRQIGGLITIAEAQDRRMDALRDTVADLATQVANTERQWQAYINTLPRQ